MGIFSKIKLLFVGVSISIVVYSLGLIEFQCPVKTLIGLKCPMCNSTTSVRAFLHGEFIHGFALNPLSIYFTVLLLISYLKFFELSFNYEWISHKQLDKWFFGLTDWKIGSILLPLNFIYLNFIYPI